MIRPALLMILVALLAMAASVTLEATLIHGRPVRLDGSWEPHYVVVAP
jgi:hypothetical protein